MRRRGRCCDRSHNHVVRVVAAVAGVLRDEVEELDGKLVRLAPQEVLDRVHRGAQLSEQSEVREIAFGSGRQGEREREKGGEKRRRGRRDGGRACDG